MLSYYNAEGNFSLLLPAGWQVTGPERTRLGNRYVLGPPGTRFGEVLVDRVGGTQAIEIASGLCPTCAIDLRDVVVNGRNAQMAAIGGETWLFSPHDGDLIAFKIRTPATLEPLWGLIQTFTYGPEPQGPSTVPSAQAAQRELSRELGVSPYVIAVRSADPAEWNDACLGWAEPGQACAQAITHGYAGQLEVRGQLLYGFRADENGRIVRLLPLAVQRARDALAEQLGTQAIAVAGWQRIDWPDACLGSRAEGEMCAQTLTPGYRATLEAGSRTYVYHTDLSGQELRQETGAALEEPALEWNRTGGIAGFCDKLVVYVTGTAVASSGGCGGGQAVERGRGPLASSQLDRFAAWVDRLAPFEWAYSDPPAAADAMTLELVFTGKGSAQATTAEQEAIQAFAADVFAQTATP